MTEKLDNQGDRLIGFLKVKTIGKNPYEYVIIVREDFLTNPLSGVKELTSFPTLNGSMITNRVTDLNSLKLAITSLLLLFCDQEVIVEILDGNPSQAIELNEMIIELPFFIAQSLRVYLLKTFGIFV